LHEGWPGVGVVETANVGVKNDLMRAYVVILKDGGENVVLVVEALVTPVGVTGVAIAEKVRRGLPERLDERDRWEELDRKGGGVTQRVSQQRGHQWLQTGESAARTTAKALTVEGLSREYLSPIFNTSSSVRALPSSMNVIRSW